MKILNSCCYGFDRDDKRYRHKLKKRLLSHYPDQLQFVQPSGKSVEVVFSKEILTQSRPEFDQVTNIKVVAQQLREDIMTYCNKIPEHSWPPTFQSLTQEYKEPPESIKKFLNFLLTSGKHEIDSREKTKRLVNSFTADFIYIT